MSIRNQKLIDDANSQLFNDVFNVQELNKFEAVYLLSSKDINKKLQLLLKKDLKNKKKLIFIASDPDNYKKIDEKFKKVCKDFKKLGIIEFEKIDSRITSFVAIKYIQSADVLYLMGGDPIKQINFIESMKIAPFIKEFKGILIGYSAGAMNLCNDICMLIDKGELGRAQVFKEHNLNQKSFIYKGLGLVDITVEPHFTTNNKNITKEFLKSKLDIIGLPDGSFIKVDKYGTKNIYGTYYIKENDKIIINAEKSLTK